MQEIFDPVRKLFVQALPEEKIRQALLRHMVKELKFPISYLSVEIDLKSLPHLKNKPFPLKRRADIICFAKNKNLFSSLFPLLMIECKSHPLSERVVEQVIGYNHYVKAHFICVCNANEIKTLWYDRKEKKYISVSFLPTYDQLLKTVEGKI